MASRLLSRGFSQMQALPAAATWMTRAAWVEFGVTMMTPSTRGSAKISSTEEATLGCCDKEEKAISLRP